MHFSTSYKNDNSWKHSKSIIQYLSLDSWSPLLTSLLHAHYRNLILTCMCVMDKSPEHSVCTSTCIFGFNRMVCIQLFSYSVISSYYHLSVWELDKAHVFRDWGTWSSKSCLVTPQVQMHVKVDMFFLLSFLFSFFYLWYLIIIF